MAPDQKMVSEPGTMLTMSKDVETEIICDNCCARMCGGEPPMNVSYTNTGSEPGFVGFTPNTPSKIIPLSLDKYPNGMNAQKGAYMLSQGQVSVGCLAIHPRAGVARAHSGRGTLVLTRPSPHHLSLSLLFLPPPSLYALSRIVPGDSGLLRGLQPVHCMLRWHGLLPPEAHGRRCRVPQRHR